MVPGLVRFSLPWWLVMAGMTGSLGTISAATLWWFDLLHDWQAILMAAGVIITGDILAAIGMAMVAPTRITLNPGEKQAAVAEVLSAFKNGSGRVRVQGESWRARLHEDKGQLPVGSQVRVRGREGLVLIVERLGST